MSEQNVQRKGHEKWVSIDGKPCEVTTMRTDWKATAQALEQSLAHERQELSNLRAEFAHERQQREAAEARGNALFLGKVERRCGEHIIAPYPEGCTVCLATLTAKLLALAEGQRTALRQLVDRSDMPWPKYGEKWGLPMGEAHNWPSTKDIARAALATDLDALVAEAKELGVELHQGARG